MQLMLNSKSSLYYELLLIANMLVAEFLDDQTALLEFIHS